MAPEQAEQIASLRARLDAATSRIAASGERVVALGERAARAERRAPERRAIIRAVRRVRIAITTPRPAATTWPLPAGGGDHTGQRTVTQPLRPGAP